jgi:hypothetical protein
MFKRLTTTSLAGTGALVLVLVVSGVVAAASVLTTLVAPVADPDEPALVDTSRTWEDVDGDGVDDDCDDVAEANAEDAAAAVLAVDLDGDGTISVSEAAQSEWTGGTNCNHGGYVSGVAREQCNATTESGEPTEAVETTTETTTEDDAECADAEEPAEETVEETAEEEPPAECEATTEGPAEEPADAEEPTTDEPVDVSPNAHGKAVSAVAKSDAVGGKNCNHGGAVSEQAHEDKADREAAREAAKAAREAARDAKRATKGGNGKGHGH